MSEVRKRLSLENFREQYKNNNEEKLLEQALVYLKLRDYGCPKSKALVFAKKYYSYENRKERAIDATKTKDGPAGFKKLIPQKPQGVLGWLKGEKLQYRGLRGYSSQAKRKQQQSNFALAKVNKQGREKFEEFRLNLKMKNESMINGEQPKTILQQIGFLKDEFMKDRERRLLFLSYDGVRMDQYTRNYFEKIQQQNPDSLVTKLAAFENPLNDNEIKLQTDWQNAKGKSLSRHQVQGQTKRKQVLDFRKSLTNLRLPQWNQPKIHSQFRTTLRNSNLQFTNASLGKTHQQKSAKSSKELKQFYKNIDKIAYLKSKQIQLPIYVQNIKQ